MRFLEPILNSFIAAIIAALGLGNGCDRVFFCPELEDGARITFRIAEEEEITLWISNDTFIDEAITLLGQGPTRVPSFRKVIPISGCADEDWSWHVDPEDLEWADMTIEICDARPSYIEENLSDWIREVGGWCPWSAAVIAVEDFR